MSPCSRCERQARELGRQDAVIYELRQKLKEATEAALELREMLNRAYTSDDRTSEPLPMGWLEACNCTEDGCPG